MDYFRLRKVAAGRTIIAEVVRGQLDSVIGVFDKKGNLLNNPVLDDDAGAGLLSKSVVTVPKKGDYFIAVSFCCDYDLDGDDPGQGAPFDLGRYVLNVQVIDGIPLTLGDDDFVQMDLGFTFPFQGQNYTDVFVNANGNLTFGSQDTTFFNWEETVPDFLAGPPRIAPLWDDLSPNAGGLVIFKEGTNCVRVSFQDVPEFPNSGSNTFSVVFDVLGNIQFDYGALSAPDGLVGITQGNGAAFTAPLDLSTGGPFPILGTTYEIFPPGLNDLTGATVVFGSSTSCN